ncbi:MAG: hypothetical protein JXA64_01445 [Candidatus Fermentibacteraceae bacterium]|nr:hypothetical protein [Candidatus Fermentibacteraceae bacterium]MBN2607751.1 hypothetical protein [Candidatus Fermentibacteraceae bacterium]
MNRTIDTFSDFLSFWEMFGEEDIESRIRDWAGEYMAKWPGLLEKQVNDYSNMSLDWREVARERISSPSSVPGSVSAEENTAAITWATRSYWNWRRQPTSEPSPGSRMWNQPSPASSKE